MKEARTKPYDHFLHPYIFLLKEGQEIQNDFLDYSLLLLQVGQADILASPHHFKSLDPTYSTTKNIISSFLHLFQKIIYVIS